MTEPTPPPNRDHPWLDIHGPRADIPASGGPGELPYAAPKRRSKGVVFAGVGVLLLGAATLAALTSDGGDGRTEAAGPAVSSTTSDAATTAAPVTSTTRAPERSTTTAAPATTTTEARTPSTTSATSKIPVAQLPRHEAVYRDGKLILQGTVPSRAVQERFRSEAAAVIGAGNVIVRYQIDPRVPVPTDGRVRVDEDFLFPKNSAAIDARYEPLMQLGVTVMRLNPQATMRIVGYTDDSGTPEFNLRLSTARAEALRSYLAANGVDPARIEAVGRGEVDFVAPNDSEENRGRNRRIEIELIGLLKE
ncbi:MAG: hypothetical protein JWO77_1277 [Ilumatobacteraceae bacterium]|nr:hypothetical protein [Ilumatobacteraceae bacterium]